MTVFEQIHGMARCIGALPGIDQPPVSVDQIGGGRGERREQRVAFRRRARVGDHAAGLRGVLRQRRSCQRAGEDEKASVKSLLDSSSSGARGLEAKARLLQVPNGRARSEPTIACCFGVCTALRFVVGGQAEKDKLESEKLRLENNLKSTEAKVRFALKRDCLLPLPSLTQASLKPHSSLTKASYHIVWSVRFVGARCDCKAR